MVKLTTLCFDLEAGLTFTTCLRYPMLVQTVRRTITFWHQRHQPVMAAELLYFFKLVRGLWVNFQFFYQALTFDPQWRILVPIWRHQDCWTRLELPFHFNTKSHCLAWSEKSDVVSWMFTERWTVWPNVLYTAYTITLAGSRCVTVGSQNRHNHISMIKESESHIVDAENWRTALLLTKLKH